MARYHPPRVLRMPYERLVTQADPTYYRDRAREDEYVFSRRIFKADHANRGIYGTRWDFNDDFSGDFLTFAEAEENR